MLERVVASSGCGARARGGCAASKNISAASLLHVPRAGGAQEETALGDSSRARAPACEYFAAAATLLARAAGVPARYATGYARRIQRAGRRVGGAHAPRHAWTRAWVDGRWIDSMPRPHPGHRRGGRSASGRAWRTCSLRGYRWSQRGEFKAGDSWYAVLAASPSSSMARAARAPVRAKRRPPPSAPALPRRDSEFYAPRVAAAARPQRDPCGMACPRCFDFASQKLEQLREALRCTSATASTRGHLAAERNRLRELCLGFGPRTQ